MPETSKPPVNPLGLWREQRNGLESELQVSDVLRMLVRHLPSIIALTMLGLAVALAFITHKAPTYTALTQILVDARSKAPVDTTGNVAAGQIIPDPGLMESQEKILQSFSVLSRVIERENLTADPEFTRRTWERLRRWLARGATQEAPEALEMRVMQNLMQHMRVRRTSSSYVIDAEVSSESPAKAARLAHALADAYLADQAAAKSGEARQANTMLDGRLGELREQVRLAETAVEDFRSRNGLQLATGSLVDEQQLAQANAALVQAQATTAEATARQARMARMMKGGGLPDAISESLNSQVIQRLRDQFAAASQREAALAGRLQASHPDMLDARARLTALRGQLDAELRRILDGSSSELEIARNRETQLAQRVEAMKQETQQKNQARVQLAALEREAATLRKQLETFLGRERDTREQQQLFMPDARVITPAMVPSRPSSPNKPIVLLLGLLGGAAAGIAQALMRSQTDDRVRSAGGIEQTAGLRFLLALPAFDQRQMTALTILRRKGNRLDLSSRGFLAVLESLALSAGGKRNAYRTAIMRLVAQLRGGEQDGRGRCLLVVSPATGEGKSCLALSLARADAQLGARTLLVDADFRNPDLSTVFTPDAAEDADSDDLAAGHLTDMIYRFDEADADVLPLSAVMLAHGRTVKIADMIEFLRTVVAGYDRIVIDAGALLDDGIALAFLPLADQVVMVARSGTTRMVDLLDAARMIDVPLAHGSGVVLTMAPDADKQRPSSGG